MSKYVLILISLFFACKVKNNTVFKPNFSPGPPAIVYKTKKDYSKNIPVILSDDKLEIVSYPHPNDVKTVDGFQYPTQLKNGYLLDNRGININVAFLKLTYEEYTKMPVVPSLKELYGMIIEKNPILEMYNCGNKKSFKNIVQELNSLIKNKQLKTECKVLK